MVGGCRAAWLAALCLCAKLAAAPAQDPPAAQQHADKAVEYIQAGDLPRAESELRRAISLAPGNSSYLTSLGGILGTQGKLQEANVYFERAVRANPADAGARRNLAANQWRLRQFKEAQANLERLLRAQPGDKTAILLLGMVAENTRDYPRAAKLLGSIPDVVAQRPESVAALASAYYHTSRREQAGHLMEELLGRRTDPQGIFTAAGVAAEAGDYVVAEKLFTSIRDTFPDRARVEYDLALIEYRTGRVAESQKTLLELVSEGRAPSDAYVLLGRCYQQRGNSSEAIQALQEATRRNPEKESNYLALAAILVEANKVPVGLEVARRLVAAFPNSAPAFRMQGLIQIRMEQYADAVRSFSRAVQLDSSSLDARIGLASAQWAAGMRSEAQAGFEALIRQNPREPEVYEAFGTRLLASAPDEATESRAAALLETALGLDSSRGEAHYQLGNLALKKGQSASALEHLEAAARLAPWDSRVPFALARVYRRLGRADDAAKAMRRYDELKAREQPSREAQAR